MSSSTDKPPPQGSGSAEAKSGLKGLTEIKDSGWKKGDSTAMFRAINPELFVKPNKVVMWVGVVFFSSAVGYLAYLRATQENKATYVAMDENEVLRTRKKQSRWD